MNINSLEIYDIISVLKTIRYLFVEKPGPPPFDQFRSMKKGWPLLLLEFVKINGAFPNSHVTLISRPHRAVLIKLGPE